MATRERSVFLAPRSRTSRATRCVLRQAMSCSDSPHGFQFVLSTKVGRYGAADFDFSAARVTASVEARARAGRVGMLAEGAVLLRQESLERLCVDYIDIIQCHDIEFGSLQQLVEETLPGAQRAASACTKETDPRSLLQLSRRSKQAEKHVCMRFRCFTPAG